MQVSIGLANEGMNPKLEYSGPMLDRLRRNNIFVSAECYEYQADNETIAFVAILI